MVHKTIRNITTCQTISFTSIPVSVLVIYEGLFLCVAMYFALSIVLVSFSCVAAVVVTYLYYLGEPRPEVEVGPVGKHPPVPAVPWLLHSLLFLSLGRVLLTTEVNAIIKVNYFTC